MFFTPPIITIGESDVRELLTELAEQDRAEQRDTEPVHSPPLSMLHLKEQADREEESQGEREREDSQCTDDETNSGFQDSLQMTPDMGSTYLNDSLLLDD
ncbi:hypothetical protein KIPB_009442 [Kipferlia bialata]|uniref:Uncharacterized protein n=1 Tax=Kipferlia bialata TaxID=797122 RepID=A0A9K3D1N9_9EUKA|nr:hypothetical protein KIPB_009442 [Kipferlia bialata]|eukprot:g9442.t1